jgi:hypothetical protein
MHLSLASSELNMISRLLAFALGFILMLTGCSKPVERPIRGKSGGTKDAVGTPYSGKNPDQSSAPAIPEIPSQIQLVNTKFAGDEDKLEAIVKYAGATSPRYKLNSEAGLAIITVPGLLKAMTDTLIVELYEAENLRFIARRIATTVEKDKSNSWKLEDCLVTKVPWDGEKNEGSCGWTIQDVK